ncbi:hypothetical protein D3C75_1233960 [compost metagenome]
MIADQRLMMTGTGQLHGNILAGTLSITEGCVLNGSIAMAEEPATEKAAGELQKKEHADKAGQRGSKQAETA